MTSPEIEKISRLGFILRYRTLSRCAKDHENPKRMLVHHNGTAVPVPARCPHEGAPFELGFKEGEFWVCSWHGCRIDLKQGKFKKSAP